MKNKPLYILLIFVFALNLPMFSQTQTAGKPINDGSGQFAQKVVGLFNPSPGAEARQKAMEPFVIGFFGWKAMRYANLGVGKLEAMHLDICRLTLQMYDNELDPTITAIQARAKSSNDAEPGTQQEIAAIRKFVINKYGGKFLGVGQWLNPDQPERNKGDEWRFSLGSALGEMGADITLWYVFPNHAPFDKNMAERLHNLSRNIADAPLSTPPDLVNKLKTLSALGNKQKYTSAEKQNIADAFKLAIDAAMMLAYIPTTSAAAAQNRTTKPVTTPTSTTPVKTTQNTTASSTPNKATADTMTKPTLPRLSIIAPAALRKRADELLTQGKELAAAKKFDEAIAKFTDAAKIDPQYAMVYFHRALAYNAQALTDKAIDDANTYIMLNPGDGLGYYNRGIFYLNRKSYAMARDDFSKGISIDPKDPRFVYNRGVAHYNLADYDKAQADFSTALMLDTNYINAYISRALVHCKKGLPLSAYYDQDSAIRLGAKITKGCPK